MEQQAKVWSPFQQDIFSFVGNGQGNAIVTAVAGSGKTTTLVEAIKQAFGNVIFLAFNKTIADELKSRGVNARTFHSLVFSPVMKSRNAKDIEQNKLRKLCDQNLKGLDNSLYSTFICRLVGLGRQAGIGCLVPDVEEQWLQLCIHHDIEPEHEEANLGRGLELASELLSWSNASHMVDFDDLLYFAVKDGISLPKFHSIFVDEAQDTNAIQRAILRKIMFPISRLVAVGDPGQAIYGFRGADSESMNLIASEFNCIQLPLSISYRCAQSIVKYAQQWVPHIQASPTAPEGEVVDLKDNWKTELFQAGDLVVCRKTAPLLTTAYTMMRKRQPVTVIGKEIGAGLKAMIRKMNTNDLDEMQRKLHKWVMRQVEKLIARNEDGKREELEDKASAIDVLVDSMDPGATVTDLLLVIDELFKDKLNAVRLCTIHKAKGLEAPTVYWLGRNECPSKWARQDWQKQQEVNLCYVAATRAIMRLVLLNTK